MSVLDRPKTFAVGLFASRDEAERAVTDLYDIGFSPAEIGLASLGERGAAPVYQQELPWNVEPRTAAGWAESAAAVGAGVGSLWGIGIVAGLLPALGYISAGGILGSIIASGFLGAAIGGLVGGVLAFIFSSRPPRAYFDSLGHGRVMVSVRAGTRFDEAADILRRHGAYGIERRIHMR